MLLFFKFVFAISECFDFLEAFRDFIFLFFVGG